ncbi:MAG TPA: hypothetical protein VFH78_11200 [Candidatus Thermoplasmatota archaeon]|nr:hypothetical protein [Candidatus Thermoplasmatota archaeon]
MRTQHIFAALAIAALAMPAALADPPARAAPAEGSLDRLAELFGERPLTLTGIARGAACGSEGHCSFTQCNLPTCAPGETPVCNCVASSEQCEDAHNPWNPFDNDSHALFDCSCGCTGGGEPPACTVHDPRDPDKCLVGPLPGVIPPFEHHGGDA